MHDFHIFKWLENILKGYLVTHENDVKFKLQPTQMKPWPFTSVLSVTEFVLH